MNPASIAIAAVIFSGLLAAVQPATNSALASALHSSLMTAFISFSVGAVILLLLVFVTRDRPNFETARQLPWYMWTGGLYGILFVSTAPYAVARIGSSSTMILFILGQIIMSVVLDHVGAFGITPRPINFGRVSGLTLVALGVLLVRKS